MKAYYKKHLLCFKQPGGTSRGVLTHKETWFIFLEDENQTGIGECGLFRGLSCDDVPEYERVLNWTCNNVHLGIHILWDKLKDFPSIQFGIEQAFQSLKSESSFVLYPSQFTKGEKAIPINGLIWMGDQGFMKEQIAQKVESGFTCIKMKIGALDFEKELKLLKIIRKSFSREQIELRVDANGAFHPDEALFKLEELAALDIHSIEQPLKQGQWPLMAKLCKETPLDIALDEELIGIKTVTEKEKLLQTIKPQYIILKPSLIGGWRGSEEWISIADTLGISWWVTSALESNIGLNAIAQWTYRLNSSMYQGLGTGGLFTNNIDSPLLVKNGCLTYDPDKKWKLNILEQCI